MDDNTENSWALSLVRNKVTAKEVSLFSVAMQAINFSLSTQPDTILSI
jgi:hypothetical protein